MSTWLDRVRDLLRSTDEVKVVLEAISISNSSGSPAPDTRQDTHNKRILAIVSHKDDWDLTEEGCVFVCKTKLSSDGHSEELHVQRIFPIYGSFSIVMGQMRRSTIDLRGGLQKAAAEQPRSGFSLAVTPAEGLKNEAKPVLFYIQDVQELRDFVAESRRLKEETTIENVESFDVSQSTTHFSWLRPYLLKHISPILASVPPDILSANQPILDRLSVASAGQPGDDASDLQLMRNDWVRTAARKASCSGKQSLRLRVGTFNVNGKMPSQDLSSWIQGQPSLPPLPGVSPLSLGEVLKDPFEKLAENVHTKLSLEAAEPLDPTDTGSDLLVLGFQELDLSTEALIYSTGTTREDAWCHAVFAALGEKADIYEKLASKQLVGMLIVIIVKKNLRQYFSDVQNISAGAGILGVMGNKGGTAIRVSFTPPKGTHPTVLTFVNAHLAAFDEMVDKRNQDFHDLSKRLNFTIPAPLKPEEDEGLTPSMPTSTVYESDAVVWLGDLNYRIDIPDLDIRRILQDEDWNNQEKFASLLRYDQLYKAAASKKAFVGFHESRITHLPTYRFSPGVGMDTLGYDLKRKPAWTDRILYIPSSTCRMEQLSYTGHPQITLSDHRPVAADFRLEADVLDHDTYTANLKTLHREVDHLEGSHERKGLKLDDTFIDFRKVRYQVPVAKTVKVTNASKGPCAFRFVPVQTDSPIHPEWLAIHPKTGILLPDETTEITFTAFVSNSTATLLNRRPTDLSGTLILHTMLGKDHFISVSGEYQPTCFGNSLSFLTQLPGPIRTLKSPNDLVDDRHRKNAPAEIIRLINWLMTNSTNVDNIFLQPADDGTVLRLCECLDTGADFPYPAAETADPQVPLAFGEVLLRLLNSLPDPVIPGILHPQCVEMSNRDEAFEVLDVMQPAAVNVWISLTAFLHFLGKSSTKEGQAEQLASVFAPILLRDDPTSFAPPISPTKKRQFLLYFIS